MKLTFLSTILLATVILGGCSDDIVHDLKTTQDNLQFIKENYIQQYQVSTDYQRKLSKQYLTFYFSPWHNPYLFNNEKNIKADVKSVLDSFKKNQNWQSNKQTFDTATIAEIIDNINYDSFPNINKKAITVVAANLRMLPTDKPAFSSWKKESDAYPFDNLQASYLQANLPLYVLHSSRDGAWKFVTTSENMMGWIHSNDIAYVNNDFIKVWEKQNYITTIKENIGILDQQSHFYLLTRLGQIYPLKTTSKTTYQFLVATADANQQAVIKTVQANKQYFLPWPLPANTKNIAIMANKFLNEPYGWGSMYGYRDCSATTEDLFASFGIWLPRNSQDQAKIGRIYSLANQTNSNKKQLIAQRGIPYFALISMPGHIGLYIGTHNNTPYIFNQRWGIRKDHWWNREKNRFIIGRTVITALDFDKNFLSASSDLLTITQSINILIPPQALIPLQ